MKKLILGLLLLVSFNGWGQEDGLEFTNRRAVADTVFGLLNQKIYGHSLIDRSLTEDSILIKEIRGDYNVISSGYSWLQAYSDIAVSYTDPKYMLVDTVLIDKVTDSYVQYEMESEEEKVIQPFGLLLHQVSKLDSNLYHRKDAFSNQRSQLRLNPSIDERQIYNKVMLKEAALLELYGKHGYEEGIIMYNPEFISIGPNIKLRSIQLDVGNGFQEFSRQNDKINYRIDKDWQIGRAAVNYDIDGKRKMDTLIFYLTTEIYEYKGNESSNHERGKHRWDDKGKFESIRHGKLKYAIRYGCGNNNKIRRPVIIAPPYRPAAQFWVSLNKYYDQFNFKSLISSLADMGYDVIFIKETPGNRSISNMGNLLAVYLEHINLRKKQNYPNEDWENVVIGLSAGGQQWRWALKKMEKEHMDWGTPHHHTRLYIPFDSPHWGANVPMFAQAVYYDFNASLNILAAIIYNTLKDDASRSMLMNHITGSYIEENGHDRIIYPVPDVKRQEIVSDLKNAFNHQFTPMNDLRKSFPTFTRNVAVSTGHNTQDYEDEFGLNPGKKLFSQNAFIPDIFGPKTIKRKIYSSEYASEGLVFSRRDRLLAGGFVPIWRKRNYKTKWAYEWDMAQGGYKDEFYDGFGTSPVSILRSSVFFSGFTPGQKFYNDHMSFLPMVSALAINDTIWQNNNLYYNVKDEGLMYNDFNSNTQSNTYGYPNLGHPNTHFNITPFEAIYCDPITSEHIKMQKSAGNNHNKNSYLVRLRDFILDEVEADIVYLQNKTIGKNHVQWKPSYRYKAWYKAHDKIVFGSNVTPKTDPGPYIIEKTGEITAYACNGVLLTDGFHTKQGSSFHAFEYCGGCSRPREKSGNSGNEEDEGEMRQKAPLKIIEEEKQGTEKILLKVYPNPSNKGFTIAFSKVEGEYIISNTNGKIVQQGNVLQPSMLIHLAKGVYLIKWINKDGIQTQKMIAL